MKIAIVCLALLLSIHVAFRVADQPQQIAFAEVHAGDTLPSLPLRSAADSIADPNPTTLDELFDGRCGVVHFFLSSCPGCARLAPLWSGRDSIRAGQESHPIAWVFLEADTGAPGFLRSYDLQGATYFSSGLKDWARIGVSRTPTTYILQGGVLKEVVQTTPSELEAGRMSCSPGSK